jgi:hypothetical protein
MLKYSTPPSKRPSMRKRQNDAIAVFDWLREKLVRKIIRVDFIDNELFPHTNEAIENALKGFEVEILNWKKPDLSCELVYNSTSVLSEISLYCSGNTTVLNIWGGPEGFINARKFPKVDIPQTRFILAKFHQTCFLLIIFPLAPSYRFVPPRGMSSRHISDIEVTWLIV